MATKQTDNRYSRNKYNQTKYGASSGFADLLWGLLIDWDGDGDYALDGNQAQYLRGFTIERTMRDAPFTTNSAGQAQLARNKVGKVTLTLDNSDRRFDPWYTSSPLYPNVKPGRATRLLVRSGGVTYNLFTGTLDAPEGSGYARDPITRITGVDGWQFLVDTEVRTTVQTTKQIYEMLSTVLTAVGWDGGSTLDSVAGNTFAYVWADQENAYTAIHRLAEAELGIVYIAVDGSLHYVAPATLSAESPAFTLLQTQVLNEPVVSVPWDYIRNSIKVYFYVTPGGDSGPLWVGVPFGSQGANTLQIANGQTLNWDVKYTHASGVAGLPVASTNPAIAYACYDGNDYTVDNPVTLVLVSTCYATSAKFSLTNNSGVTGYISALQAQGLPLYVSYVSAATNDDATSQATYKKRMLVHGENNMALSTESLAATVAASLIKWKDPLPVVTVELVNRPTIQFAYDLGTRLTFTSAYLNINRDFRIIKIKHRSGATMQEIFTTWTLEPIP